MRNPLSALASIFTRKSLAAPSLDLLEALGAVQGTAAGVSVTRTTALRCTPVMAAVRSIADPIAGLPIRLVRKGDDGSRTPDPTHPVARLLTGEWCAWLSSHEARRQITIDALTCDIGGVGLVTRVDGQPREIVRMPPGSVTATYSALGEPSWRLAGEAGGRDLDAADIVHIPSPFASYPDPRCPVTLARDAIGVAIVLERHAGRLFANGGRPSGMLSFADALQPEAVKRIRETWRAAHGGENSGGTAILDKGATFAQLALTSVDAQFMELRTFAVEEIARAFGVPPHRLYELGRATWSNVSDMGREFRDFTLSPWIKTWEAGLGRALLTAEERDVYAVEMDSDDLALPSLADQATAYSALIASRIVNPNEARAWMSLPAYPGGDAFENPNTTSGATTASVADLPPEVTP